MDWLTWVLFESSVALAILLGLVNFLLLVYWRRGGSPRPLLAGLALAAGLLTTQAVVETKREAASGVLDNIVRGLRAGSADATGAMLAREFRAGDMDREAFVGRIREQLLTLKVRTANRMALSIESAGDDRFQISVSYFSEIALESYVGPVRSRWTMEFVRTPDGWRISSIDPPRVEGVQFNGWSTVWR